MLGVLFRWSSVLIKIAFNRDLAEVEGVRAVAWDYLFMVLLALTVAVSLKLVGIVLVSALIIIPAAAARNVAPDFRVLMGLAAVIGVMSAASGLILSYYLDTASGPTIVMVAIAVFIASFAARAIRR